MTPRRPRIAALALGFVAACRSRDPASDEPPPVPSAAVTGATATAGQASAPIPRAVRAASAPSAGSRSSAASADSSSAETLPPPPCPGDMVLVQGNYCPAVIQPCTLDAEVRGHHCRRYGESRCAVTARVALRFCMDRYEWPNRVGELPLTLVSWPRAREHCTSVGKRLCTEREFNFACEGEGMKPFVYGFERSDSICNADRPYRQRTYAFTEHDSCMATPACKAAYDAIDQRRPAGSMPGCVSEDGVYDLNGNANEWVLREDQRSPRRSGLKGGWWGPVRNRCRPMTTFHLEGDFGYEAGFRCCRDSGG